MKKNPACLPMQQDAHISCVPLLDKGIFCPVYSALFLHLFDPLYGAALMIALTEVMSEKMSNRYPALASRIFR